MIRTVVGAAILTVAVVTNTPPAHAIGCLSGGAAGALAGHMAGHGVLGAVGGCVAGHAWHRHRVNQQDLRDQNSYNSSRQSQDPSYRSPWQQ